jgi:hypothetical protein
LSEIVAAQIVKWEQDGNVLIRAAVPSLDRAINRDYDKGRVLVEFFDGRKISRDQQKKAHALIGEIADWAGYLPNEAKRLMKIEFKTTHLQSLEKKIFSLADADKTLSREFISFLIDFMIENGVPSKIPLYEQCEDIGRYVYACLMHKTCAVCGRRADVHHLHGSRVGHGGLKWRTKDQAGAVVIPLCREHHQSAHLDEEGFLARYHLQGVEMTREIAKVYGAKMGGRKDEGKSKQSGIS